MHTHSYSTEVNSYSTTRKTDPYYNSEAFFFIGKTYITKALSFAMRYRTADLAATYDVEAFLHPNSNLCQGLDHSAWSLVLARVQSPFNSCPYWFTGCAQYSSPLTVSYRSLRPLPPGVEEVVLERGRPVERMLASSSKSSYSTASCSAWSSSTPGFSTYTFFVLWNTLNGDDVKSKEVFLTSFATAFSALGAIRNSQSCANYNHTHGGAVSSSIVMCTEVNGPSPKNWFPSPYGYAAIIVPATYFDLVLPYIMQGHFEWTLQAQTSFITAGINLHYFIVPNSGCTYYDFEKWSAKSVNNTIPFNYYPMLNPATVFRTAAVGGVTPDKIAMSSTSCTVSGWKLFAPYLYNNLMAYSSGPKYSTTFNTNLAAKTTLSSYYTSTQYASTSYATSTTMSFSTAYYQYSIPYTDASFAKVLKYALLTRVSTKVDTTYSIYTQPLVLQRNSGCADYDNLLFTGHSDAFDWPINNQPLDVASYFGGSSRRASEAGKGEDGGFASEAAAAAYDAAATAEQDPAAAVAAEQEPEVQWHRRLSSAGCIAAYELGTTQTSSWTLHITYVINNPTSAAKALALCTSLYSSYGGSTCSTTWAFSPTSTYYGYASVKVLGNATPPTSARSTSATMTTSSGLQSTYSFALNVPDASLSSLLQKVMAYASSTSDISAALGWFLVPNLYSSATATACSISDLYSNFYLQEEPRPWIYSQASGSSTTLTTSLSTTSRRLSGAAPPPGEGDYIGRGRGLARAYYDASNCSLWKPSPDPLLNFGGFLRKYYCAPLGLEVSKCILLSTTNSKGVTTAYNASSYINGNEYLPPRNCTPTRPGNGTLSPPEGGGGNATNPPPRGLEAEERAENPDSGRELAAAPTVYTETYTIQIFDAPEGAIELLFSGSQSGALTSSSDISDYWATAKGFPPSSVKHAPFLGGQDQNGVAFGSEDVSIPAPNPESPNPDLGSSDSSPSCGSGCIVGAVVGSVAGAALLLAALFAMLRKNLPGKTEVPGKGEEKPASTVIRVAVSV